MKLADFDYQLPQQLIAQHPARERTASRLLHLDGRSGKLSDLAFADLPGLVEARDAVVLNDTRVIKARLFGRKASGGRVELFIERIAGEYEALGLMRAGHSPKPGTRLSVGDGAAVEVLGREEDLYRVRFAEPVAAVLERCGNVPLPPYITHRPGPEDRERYQTVYARNPGAVAAPTAGLHFDEAMLKKVAEKGASISTITLHVGAGTFLPVRAEIIEQHRMHKEHYEIPPGTHDAIAGRRVLAVGTTTLRALETAALTGAQSGETDLFIHPGFRFRVVERLLTNFHLPRSSLLMLVSAFGGLENIRRAYAHAIRERYRFFSYGDAMLIEKAA
ncbi:MAG: tRNA preQ1(34) S-adenosylmethionine ribosyltransferase-isomerase QueA [Betaproteobacteria bacterium RBG_16_66_20]|nr:MAG: tRNA preQ1(34) S-adenosylmethionine ribosyltransferase-isomerase QueA [Betaproteobacteria bacterium RBG_16_66_20]